MITKIVLTGGPCAGKTTTNERIEEFFSKLGYAVFTLPEAATLFIKAGAEFLTQDKNLYFEIHKNMMRFLLEMEEDFYRIAEATGKSALIINDRGAMDLSAYMTPEDWQRLLRETGHTEEELMARYKAVFHLCTSAKGAPNSYTLSNNSARMEETLAEAIQIRRICQRQNRQSPAWYRQRARHPRLRQRPHPLILRFSHPLILLSSP